MFPMFSCVAGVAPCLLAAVHNTGLLTAALYYAYEGRAALASRVAEASPFVSVRCWRAKAPARNAASRGPFVAASSSYCPACRPETLDARAILSRTSDAALRWHRGKPVCCYALVKFRVVESATSRHLVQVFALPLFAGVSERRPLVLLGTASSDSALGG